MNYRLLVLALNIVLILAPANVFAKSKKIISIYIVDSYRADKFPWTREINEGIIAGLKKGGLKEGRDFIIHRSTMDAYVNSTTKLMKIRSEIILNDISQKKPDLIFTTDDDAFKFVGIKIEKTPVVFNGINGDPSKYLSSAKIDSLKKPGHNITGVYQTTYFAQSLHLVKSLIPEAKNFALISDTTTTGKALLRSIKKLPASSLPMTWKETLISDEFEDWKKKLHEWEGQIDAYFLLSANAVSDKKGRLMTNDEAVNWIRDNSKIPGTASWGFQVSAGVLVSATDDGVLQGELSAYHALKILKGEKAGDLAIITPPNGIPALNLERMKILSITAKPDIMEIFIDNGKIFN